MKKITTTLLLFMIIISVFCACNNQKTPNTVSQTDFSTNSVVSEKNVTQNDAVHLMEITEMATDGIGGGEITTQKYRVCYYDVPYPFILLVGEDTYKEWDEQYNTENPNDTNEMVIKKFVQYFNIDRKAFDFANLECAKIVQNNLGGYPVMNPKDYADQETDEIYNADIIYTFDDEIINEYYLSGDYYCSWRIGYEQALEAGTYETRTTDWVDIEQMEAEINAKYGAPEVTETTTAIPEETEITE